MNLSALILLTVDKLCHGGDGAQTPGEDQVGRHRILLILQLDVVVGGEVVTLHDVLKHRQLEKLKQNPSLQEMLKLWVGFQTNM